MNCFSLYEYKVYRGFSQTTLTKYGCMVKIIDSKKKVIRPIEYCVHYNVVWVSTRQNDTAKTTANSDLYVIRYVQYNNNIHELNIPIYVCVYMYYICIYV